MRKLSQEEWIEKAKKVHGDFYDYSLIEYINGSSFVKIICPKHGMFEQNNQGDVNTEVVETNVQSKTIFDYICSWWGIIGSLASVICWYELHVRLGWWFFGL